MTPISTDEGRDVTTSPHFPPAFLHLLATAVDELNRHVGERGQCVSCGAAWPCERAVLAAFALEVV